MEFFCSFSYPYMYPQYMFSFSYILYSIQVVFIFPMKDSNILYEQQLRGSKSASTYMNQKADTKYFFEFLVSEPEITSLLKFCSTIISYPKALNQESKCSLCTRKLMN